MAKMSQAEGNPEVSSQANTYSDERAVYEVGFHVVSTVPEGEVSSVAEKIRAEIKKGDEVEIIRDIPAQKMTLAYPIERPVSGGTKENHTSTYFGSIKFETTPDVIPALQVALKGMKEILRFILVETVREDITAAPRRAVFSSDRLEGKTIEKRPGITEEKGGKGSDEELDKSIEALVS